MEIIGISNNKKQCINTIKLIDNQINSLIDYGNLSNLIVNDRKYILLNNIIFSFKTNTLNDEINLYKNNVSESKLNKIKELFDLESELYNKNIYEMSSGQLRMCYIFINILFNNKLKDIMTGYRVFNRMFVKNMPVLSPNFEIETEMSLYALDKKYIIKEIPIDYRDRPEGSSSKLNTVGDGIKVVKTIVRMFKDYRPFAFFTIVALVFLICGLAVGIPVLVEFFKTSIITKMPSAILATGLVSLAAISFQCGVLLDTITRQHKEAYELNLLKWKQIENK